MAEVTFNPGAPASTSTFIDANYIKQLADNYINGKPIFTIPEFPANYRHVSFQECLDKSIKKPLYDSESWGDKFQKASEQSK